MGAVLAGVRVADQSAVLRENRYRDLGALIARIPGLHDFCPNAGQWCEKQFADLYPVAREAGVLPLVRSALAPSSAPLDSAWIEFELDSRSFVVGPNVRGFVDELKDASHYRYSRFSVADYQRMLKAVGVRPGSELATADVSQAPSADLGWMAYFAACNVVETGPRVLRELGLLKSVTFEQRQKLPASHHLGWQTISLWFDDLVKLCELVKPLRKFRDSIRALGHDIRSPASGAQEWSKVVSSRWSNDAKRPSWQKDLGFLENWTNDLIAWGRALGLLVYNRDLVPDVTQRFHEPVPFDVVRRVVGIGNGVSSNSPPISFHPGLFYVGAQCARNAIEHGGNAEPVAVDMGWKVVDGYMYLWVIDNGRGLLKVSEETGKINVPLTSGELRSIFRDYTTRQPCDGSETKGGFGLYACALMAARCRAQVAVCSVPEDVKKQAVFPESGERLNAFFRDLSLERQKRGTAFLFRMRL